MCRYVFVLHRVLLCAKNITKHEKFRSVMYMVFTLSIIMCFLCIVRYTGKTQENRAILNDDLDSSKSVHRHAFFCASRPLPKKDIGNVIRDIRQSTFPKQHRKHANCHRRESRLPCCTFIFGVRMVDIADSTAASSQGHA